MKISSRYHKVRFCDFGHTQLLEQLFALTLNLYTDLSRSAFYNQQEINFNDLLSFPFLPPSTPAFSLYMCVGELLRMEPRALHMIHTCCNSELQ